MKKRENLRIWIAAGLIVVAAGFGIVTGCDQGGSQKALTVSPANVELNRNNETVRFSVTGGLRDLSLPLRWQVANPAVGNVVAGAGTDAEYVRISAGINIVIVKDQYGAEGYASVNSQDTSASGAGYNLTLVANPDAAIPEGVGTVTVKVINGLAPFAWSVSDSNKGSVSGGTGDTVTYRSSQPGENTVICVDRNGARGTIVITQLPL